MSSEVLRAKLDALMHEDEVQTTIATRRKRSAQLQERLQLQVTMEGKEEAAEVERCLAEARERRRREAQAAATAAAEAGGVSDPDGGVDAFVVGHFPSSSGGDHQRHRVDPALRLMRYELRKLEEAEARERLRSEQQEQQQKRHSAAAAEAGDQAATATHTGTPSSSAVTPSGIASRADRQYHHRLSDTLDDSISLSLGVTPSGASTSDDHQRGEDAISSGRVGQQAQLRGSANRRRGGKQKQVEVEDGASGEKRPSLHYPLKRHGAKGERSLLDFVQQRIEEERRLQEKHALELEAARAAAQAAEEYEARYAAMRRQLREQVLNEVFGVAFEEVLASQMRAEVEAHAQLDSSSSKFEAHVVGEAPGGVELNFGDSQFDFLSDNHTASLDELIAGAQASGLWAQLQKGLMPLPFVVSATASADGVTSEVLEGGLTTMTTAAATTAAESQHGTLSPTTSTSAAHIFVQDFSTLSPQGASAVGRTEHHSSHCDAAAEGSDDCSADDGGVGGGLTSARGAVLHVMPLLEDAIDVLSEGTCTATQLVVGSLNDTTPNATTGGSMSENLHVEDVRVGIADEIHLLRRDLAQLEEEEAVHALRLKKLALRESSSPSKSKAGSRAAFFVDSNVSISSSGEAAAEVKPDSVFQDFPPGMSPLVPALSPRASPSSADTKATKAAELRSASSDLERPLMCGRAHLPLLVRGGKRVGVDRRIKGPTKEAQFVRDAAPVALPPLGVLPAAEMSHELHDKQQVHAATELVSQVVAASVEIVASEKEVKLDAKRRRAQENEEKIKQLERNLS